MAKLKLKKFPKKPKPTASIPTLERYAQKCKDVEKYNAAIVKDSNADKAKRKSLLKAGDESRKKIETLKNKAA